MFVNEVCGCAYIYIIIIIMENKVEIDEPFMMVNEKCYDFITLKNNGIPTE